MNDKVATKHLPSSVDMGPFQMQTLSGLQGNLYNGCEIDSVLGLLPLMAPHLPKEKDIEIINAVNAELDCHSKKNSTSIQFPYASPTPINEYEEDNSLFTRAFPWLFPGGYGDFGQFREKTMNVGDWVRKMLYYQNGRFAKDKIWCFCP